MRIVFMGTPEFAVPSLNILLEAGHEILGVFTQPDKPKNRGMKLGYSAVKEYAMSNGIQVFQPSTLRDGQALSTLKELAPQLIVVAAYGKILPPDILALPNLGCINVHSSLLPKYRGAAPINWAILNGEEETGVTIMYMAQGLDTGDILAQEATLISLEENATALHDRLAEMGAALLGKVVGELAAGNAKPAAQDDKLASYAPMLSRELSPIDWGRPARCIHDQVRGLYPWPAATAELDGIRCKVLRTALGKAASGSHPGEVLQADKWGLTVACGDGIALEILELQPDGKKPMASAAFLMGHPLRGKNL